jgi:histidine triad (HIT) family protein
MASVFTQIINQELPSYTVFENDKVIAFLDIFPTREGHLLVVPKVEIDYFIDVPKDYYHEVFDVSKILTKALHKTFPHIKRVGMLVEGVEVPHFHVHLIPMVEGEMFLKAKENFTKEEFETTRDKIIKNIEVNSITAKKPKAKSKKLNK